MLQHEWESAFENFFLFCDEAGNSGTNYLDAQQPVHVLAGYLFPESRRTGLVSLVEGVQALYPQAREIKAAKLLKSPKGVAAVTSFIEGTLRLGCLPVYLVWEKRYCVAAKIVETFFDAAHNPRAEWLPTGANLDRQELAEHFYDVLPHEHLAQFASAYRSPTVESFGDSIRRLALAMDLLGNDRLADTLRGNLKDLPALVEAESFSGFEHMTDNQVRPASAASLNYPAFAQFVRVADDMLVGQGRPPTQVIHDETAEFESAFRYLFNSFTRIKNVDTGYTLQDGTPVRFGLESLQNFRTGKSSATPELQAADLLASSIRVLGLASLKLVDRTPDLERLGRALLPPLLFGFFGPTSAHVMGSQSFIGNLLQPVVSMMREMRESR